MKTGEPQRIINILSHLEEIPRRNEGILMKVKVIMTSLRCTKENNKKRFFGEILINRTPVS